MLDRQQQTDFLSFCRRHKAISDALILNTCNRLEFYFYAKKLFGVETFVGDFVSSDCWDRHKQTFYGLDVVRHLFSVSAGLESQIIGENEIFSQLKSAYSFAISCETIKSIFHHLLHCAFRATKAVKTNTNISAGALSIAQAAVELAMKAADVNVKVYVLGSGASAVLVVRHLIRKKIKDIIVVSRNTQAGEQLIEKTNSGRFVPLSRLNSCLNDADVFFAATASQKPLITAAELQKRDKPLLLIDLSVPPNVEPQAGKLETVRLFNIDSLNDVISDNNRRRLTEIPKAQAIINKHLEMFSKWFENPLVSAAVMEKAGRWANSA
jgi:glutamyl-tRNA reductase